MILYIYIHTYYEISNKIFDIILETELKNVHLFFFEGFPATSTRDATEGIHAEVLVESIAQLNPEGLACRVVYHLWFMCHPRSSRTPVIFTYVRNASRVLATLYSSLPPLHALRSTLQQRKIVKVASPFASLYVLYRFWLRIPKPLNSHTYMYLYHTHNTHTHTNLCKLERCRRCG